MGVLGKIISVERYGYVMELSNVMQASPFSFGILSHSHSHSHSNFSWTTLSKGERCMRLSLSKAPTHETRPDHNTGNYVPYSFQ